MDSFVVPLYASLFQVIGQIIFSVSWKFSHICGREVFPSWWRILELTEGPMYIQWNLDWPLFLLRDARMCNRRCLHSSMIGMLCTPFWGPSRTVQKALRCPRPESSVLTLDWTGCRLGFVVDLVEEHVGLGGSRSSWPIHEHESSELVSQHNMAIQVFGSQCSPRSALIARYVARDLRHGRQRVAPFYHDLFRLQRWSSCCHQMNVFGKLLARDLCHGRQRVAPFYHV